mmetsp:Transcript_27421/g.71999  ORF Transcript_27421/g.71999 Transcript_27421/m.71999 type:complete len:267 (+) Transcript_27421:1939-2739(+)
MVAEKSDPDRLRVVGLPDWVAAMKPVITRMGPGLSVVGYMDSDRTSHHASSLRADTSYSTSLLMSIAAPLMPTPPPPVRSETVRTSRASSMHAVAPIATSTLVSVRVDQISPIPHTYPHAASTEFRSMASVWSTAAISERSLMKLASSSSSCGSPCGSKASAIATWRSMASASAALASSTLAAAARAATRMSSSVIPSVADRTAATGCFHPFDASLCSRISRSATSLYRSADASAAPPNLCTCHGMAPMRGKTSGPAVSADAESRG